MAGKRRPTTVRFWKHVSITPECWVWAGARRQFGYGRFSLDVATEVAAHRFSYEMHHGPIPDGMVVRHKCDNPPCVNPAHLEVGTRADNSADKVERGRCAAGEGHGMAVLTEAAVREIRGSSETQAALAARFGVSQPAISQIRSRKRWTHVV